MRRLLGALVIVLVALALPASAQQAPTPDQVAAAAWQRVAQRQLVELAQREEQALQLGLRVQTAEQERDQYRAQLVAILEADEDGLAAQLAAARELLGYETQEE